MQSLNSALFIRPQQRLCEGPGIILLHLNCPVVGGIGRGKALSATMGLPDQRQPGGKASTPANPVKRPSLLLQFIQMPPQPEFFIPIIYGHNIKCPAVTAMQYIKTIFEVQACPISALGSPWGNKEFRRVESMDRLLYFLFLPAS